MVEQILSVPSAPGDLAVGEYVFASSWGDADWCDPWGVGHVSEIGDSWVRLAETGARRFPKAMRISHEVGVRIVSEYPPLEKSSAELDYGRVAKIFGLNVPPPIDLTARLADAQAEIARLRGALDAVYELAHDPAILTICREVTQ